MLFFLVVLVCVVDSCWDLLKLLQLVCILSKAIVEPTFLLLLFFCLGTYMWCQRRGMQQSHSSQSHVLFQLHPTATRVIYVVHIHIICHLPFLTTIVCY